MAMHPLYEIFQQRKQLKVPSAFLPIPTEFLVKEKALSTNYEKVGCLILAGGQGTRLKIKGPKGCVLLPFKGNKTLFELLFEKIRQKGKDLSLAVMTSPLNHEATISYLKKNACFGLTNVAIFSQDIMAMCDEEGEVFEEKEGVPAVSPDGNGNAIKHLFRSDIGEKWRKKGIEMIQIIPIDNPLAEPFDGELLAIHESEDVDLVIKCIRRNHPEEKLGVLGISNGKLMVQEYSELTTEMKGLDFSFGNAGLFSCSLEFAQRVSGLSLPWHLAYKEGIKEGKKAWMWKFETFIFDLFPYAKSFKILVADRKKCFAPIKNRTGPDSLETVKQALMTENP